MQIMSTSNLQHIGANSVISGARVGVTHSPTYRQSLVSQHYFAILRTYYKVAGGLLFFGIRANVSNLKAPVWYT